MRWLSLLVVAGLALGTLSCGKTPDKKQLKLTVPSTPTTVKQGDTAMVKIEVLWFGKPLTQVKFDAVVKLTFSQLPEGVTIEETHQKIDKDSKEWTFTLKASDKAKVVEGHKIKVSASGGGIKAEQEFTVNVKEAK